MLARRIIACLDVRDGRVVKGVQFEGLREAGDPAELARRYDAEGIDEVVILDVTATLEARQARAQTIRAVSRELFLPLCVGGGIRTEDDAATAIDAGADKVSLNSAALAEPALLTRLARRYGSQAVVVAIDAKRQDDRWIAYTRSGSAASSREVVEWAREAEAAGAGEFLLTSMDRDGTKSGFDCPLTAAVSDAVSIPVIASGGAGSFEHFAEVFETGHADAALAASIFHFNTHGVAELKQFLRARGVPCARNADVSTAAEAVQFAKEVGFPIILKPRDGAGAHSTYRIADEADLARAIAETGIAERPLPFTCEEFISGHEGFYDTLTVGGRVVFESVSHYYPNVLEAMRTRWISPQIVCTNRIDAPGYGELKTFGLHLAAKRSDRHEDWSGDLEFATVNGSIEVALPAGLGADLEAGTVNGTIDSDFTISTRGRINRQSIEGRIGDGGRKLELSTVNGGIRIRQAT